MCGKQVVLSFRSPRRAPSRTSRGFLLRLVPEPIQPSLRFEIKSSPSCRPVPRRSLESVPRLGRRGRGTRRTRRAPGVEPAAGRAEEGVRSGSSGYLLRAVEPGQRSRATARRKHHAESQPGVHGSRPGRRCARRGPPRSSRGRGDAADPVRRRDNDDLAAVRDDGDQRLPPLLGVLVSGELPSRMTREWRLPRVPPSRCRWHGARERSGPFGNSHSIRSVGLPLVGLITLAPKRRCWENVLHRSQARLISFLLRSR